MRVGGHALVLRQRLNVYVLRFERLPEPLLRCLHALAISRRSRRSTERRRRLDLTVSSLVSVGRAPAGRSPARPIEK
jgi:hypothetical protein